MAEIRRYRVEIAGLAGGPGLSTLWFTNVESSAAIVAGVEAFFTDLQAAVSNQITFTGQSSIDTIDEATDQIVGSEGVTGFNVTGTEVLAPLPSATQGLLRLRTGVFLGGREIAGHLFIPGPTEFYNEGTGVPSLTYQGLVHDAADALVTLDIGWIVYTRVNHNHAVINTVSTWAKWAYLSGRRDG